jgi:ribosome-binding factor A
MKRGYNRRDRVADLIQKSLAKIILQELSDERFRLVTITGVELSRDLSYAKVFVSMLQDDPEQIKETISTLNRMAKQIRYSLAHDVKLRITPELKFAYDESTAYGFKISNLIDSAIKK